MPWAHQTSTLIRGGRGRLADIISDPADTTKAIVTSASNLGLSSDKLVRWQAQTPKARPHQQGHAPQTTNGAAIGCGWRAALLRSAASQLSSAASQPANFPAQLRNASAGTPAAASRNFAVTKPFGKHPHRLVPVRARPAGV